MRRYGLTIDSLISVDLVTADGEFIKSDAHEGLRFYRDWITDVPDELTTVLNFRRAPALPTIPSELHGRHVVAVLCTYAGPVADGQKVIDPMKRFGRAVHDLCHPKPFVAHQAMLDPGLPRGWWYYARSIDVAELTDEVIDITVEHSLRIRSLRDLLSDLPARRSGPRRGRRRHCLQRPSRGPHVQHQRDRPGRPR